MTRIFSSAIFWTWIFWGAATLIAYTYFGYAAWLWLRSRWRPKEVRRGPYLPLVSIVVVVRNEEQVLKRKLENLLALDYPAELMQLVVVSDGSADRTEAILHEYASNPRVSVMLNQLPRGKALGLNDAFQLAQGDVVVFTDARQTIEPGGLRLLLENFADPQVGCVSGQLMLGSVGECGGQGIGSYWRIEKRIRELEAVSGSVVGATGAFYAIRRNLLVPLPHEIVLDDVYLPMQVVRQGLRVVFDARARVWDVDLGTQREFARKVRTLSGNYQLLQLAPWLLSRANPIRFEFVSHKLLRLVAPFALAAVLVASLVLRTPIYRLALTLQLAFYGLSFLSVAKLKEGLVARAAEAAFTFVVLNTAAVVAFASFVSGRKAAWIR
jgi:cellulose synthase/poly-beta-1,6-N-acetylglucosamine synthase-like glycosyltransferase